MAAYRRIAVVAVTPGKRRIPDVVGFARFRPREDQRAVGQLDDVAGLPPDVIDPLRTVPSLAVVAAPEYVVPHAAIRLLPLGEHRMIVLGGAMAEVADPHQAAVAQAAELRRHPMAAVIPAIGMGDGLV